MRTSPEVKLISYPIITDDIVMDRLKYSAETEDEWVSDSELIYEFAGRGCYKSWDKPNPATRTNREYMQRSIIDNGHFSVLEHGMYVFEIQGVSRALLAELTRHRHLSFSVESLRYCPARDFVVHPTIHERWELFGPITERHWNECLRTYFTIFDQLIVEGLPKKRAREAARMYLPLMTETDLVVSANARAWWDVLTKRWEPTADREIFELAAILFSRLRDAAPNTFNNFPAPLAA